MKADPNLLPSLKANVQKALDRDRIGPMLGEIALQEYGLLKAAVELENQARLLRDAAAHLMLARQRINNTKEQT